MKRLVKTALRNYVPRAVKCASLQLGLFDIRQGLLERYTGQHGNIVQAGPFQGMELPVHTSWDSASRLQKLIGCYEGELHPTLLQVARRSYKLVLNVGCGEGYYAVGMALFLMSQAPIFAFDGDKIAQRLCLRTAEQNQVAHRLTIGGSCSIDRLDQLLRLRERSLVVVDSEGAELDLLRPDIVPGLHASDLIIECHDWAQAGLTAELQRRFSPTHNVDLITEGPRDVRDFPFLGELTGMERAIATCEFRPRLTHWLFCTALA